MTSKVLRSTSCTLALLCVGLSACANYAEEPFEIVELPYDEGPYRWAVREANWPVDSAGVRIHEVDGQIHYQPALVAFAMMAFGDAFRRYGEPMFLDRAERHAERLRSMAIERRGALYLPYTFDFARHDIAADTQRAPWFSGFAQGAVLSAFTRHAANTGNAADLEVARRVFESFTRVADHTRPEVSTEVAFRMEDEYWIEEYPADPPERVLNGFVTGLLGIYDFYVATHDEEARAWLRRGLTTLKRHANEFRVPGGMSRYCLLHGAQTSTHYHATHIDQMYLLYRITGDSFFLELSDRLRDDCPTCPCDRCGEP